MGSNSSKEKEPQAQPPKVAHVILVGIGEDGLPRLEVRKVTDFTTLEDNADPAYPAITVDSSIGPISIRRSLLAGARAGSLNNMMVVDAVVLFAIVIVMLVMLGSGDDNGPRGSGGGGAGGRRRRDPSHRSQEELSSFTLDAIGGLDEPINYLKRAVILPLIRPEVFKAWGVRPPKGVLFHGPPGTGKTFLAKAFANELTNYLKEEVTFIYRKGSDVFSMWYGESEEKLREVFQSAKDNAPSLIFFDEIDALCTNREDSYNCGHETYARILTCFLGEMDMLDDSQKVFVIGATNRLDALDPAVIRPGRFDKHIEFDFPDEMARQRILRIHTRKWSKDDQLEEELVASLARRTVGFSGADLEKLCKDAVYKAIEENGGKLDPSLKVTEEHWLQAISQMQRTPSNSFGSALFIPTRPIPTIAKLIQPVVHQAIEKIQRYLTPESLEVSTSTCRKTLLLYCTLDRSKTFMDKHIMEGILSDKTFNKIAIRLMSPASLAEKLMGGHKPSLLAAINDVVHQAVNSQGEGVSCLVVLGINEILDMAKSDNTPTKLILTSLAKVRGPNLLLLGTSSVPPDQIEDRRISELFISYNWLNVKNLTRPQLKALFQEMLSDKLEGQRGCDHVSDLLEEVAERAARYSDKHTYEKVLSLYTSLSHVLIRNDKEGLRRDYDSILGEYQRLNLCS